MTQVDMEFLRQKYFRLQEIVDPRIVGRQA